MAIKTFSNGVDLPASDINTYLTNAGLVYVTSVTVGSAVSSVTVSNCFSSTYDSYRIVINASSASSVGNNVYYKQNGSTGSTYNVAGYFTAISSGSVTSLVAPPSANGCHIAITGTTTWSSVIDVFNPFATATTTLTATSAGSSYATNTHGYDSNAASSTGFSLTTSGGTITGGTITVYGYRKA